MADPLPAHQKLVAQPVVGSRGKQWQIVNAFGGLVRYFEGTKRQAEAEARRLEKAHG